MDEKDESITLEKAIKDLEKRFGDNFITTGNKVPKSIPRISTGIFALDVGIGGGMPDKIIMQVAGKFSSGKTTTAICLTAQVQAKGGKVAWLDTEHSLDAIWASKFGVKYEELLVAQPSTIEEASDTIETLLLTGKLDLIVLDSIAATPTEKELEESTSQGSMGDKAKKVDLMMKKINTRLHTVSIESKTKVLLINQIRDNLSPYGSPNFTPGGRQLHHLSSIIVWLVPENEPVGGKDDPKGITVKFKVPKNKTAIPLKTGSYELLFSGEINNKKAMIEAGINTGVIGKSGGWYFYKDELKKVQGLETFINGLKPEELKTIQTEVMHKLL